MKFFDEPANSERRKHDGIYTSYIFEGEGKKMQMILLDNRTFRSNLRYYRGEKNDDEKFFYPLDYYPLELSDSALLGEEQWKWLEGELKKPADIRIIGSGSQFGISFNGMRHGQIFPMNKNVFWN